VLLLLLLMMRTLLLAAAAGELCCRGCCGPMSGKAGGKFEVYSSPFGIGGLVPRGCGGHYCCRPEHGCSMEVTWANPCWKQ
jgi:hypothetical protein